MRYPHFYLLPKSGFEPSLPEVKGVNQMHHLVIYILHIRSNSKQLSPAFSVLLNS